MPGGKRDDMPEMTDDLNHTLYSGTEIGESKILIQDMHPYRQQQDAPELPDSL